MKKKKLGIKSGVKLSFLDLEDIPEFNVDVIVDAKKRSNKISVVNKKHNGRDTSTNTKLF